MSTHTPFILPAMTLGCSTTVRVMDYLPLAHAKDGIVLTEYRLEQRNLSRDAPEHFPPQICKRRLGLGLSGTIYQVSGPLGFRPMSAGQSKTCQCSVLDQSPDYVCASGLPI